MKRLALLSSCAVLLSAVPTFASGPKILVISVALDGPSRASQEAFNQAAEEAVQRAGRFDVVSSNEAFEGSASKIRQTKFTEAQSRVKDGKKFLDDLDNQGAVEAFVAALNAFRETDLTRTFAPFIDAWVLKAASHATGGELAPAKADIERVVAMRPATDFPNSFFPPELIKYAEQQKKIAAAGKGELTISTEPSGARVYVDGLLKGISPVTVKNLPAGKHFVTAMLAGWYLTQKEVSTGAETLTLLPSDNAALLKKAVDSIQKDAEGSGRDSTLRALGEKFQAAQVLAVLSRKSLAGDKVDVIVERLDVKDGHNLGFRQDTVPAGDADAVGSLADAVVAKDAPREGGPVTHFQSGGVGSGRKVAGISLLGASAAFLAVGVVSGLQAQAAADEFRRTPQVQSVISQNLANRGRTFSVVADVSWVLAAATAGTGAWLTFSSGGGQPAADDESARTPPREEERRVAPVTPRDDSRNRRDADAKKSRDDDAARKKAEAQADADRKQQEAEKKADAERKQQEADKKAAEEARQKKEAEQNTLTPAQKKAEEARKKREEAEARAKEEAEKKAEAERLKKEEADRKLKEAQDKKAEADRKQQEALEKKKADEAARKEAEAQKKGGKAAADAEKQKREKEEAEAQAREEEARKKAEEQRRADEEARKKKEAEQKKDEDDLRNY